MLSGHDHDYERTYPVRGYDKGAHGTVVSPNPDQTKGAAVDTRRPAVATHHTTPVSGAPGWNTAQGTVFLVLGGGGTNGPTNIYGEDSADRPAAGQGDHRAQRDHRLGGPGFTRNAADSVEDAPWSASRNATDAYGYAIFDVDPGQRAARRPSPCSTSPSRP